MVTVSIKDKDILKIEDEESKLSLYGSNQDWYAKRWQRMAGCGPSTVANIIYYLNKAQEDQASRSKLTKKDCLELMNEIWNYVTPNLGGVSSTGMLREGVLKYLEKQKYSIKLDYLDIQKNKAQRPELQQVVSFLVKALKQDSPAAFLNLEHGSIEELDSWHWVTVISLEYELDYSAAYVTILDGGLIKRINLPEWLHTTKLGGGFVSFEPCLADKIKR
jgi:hypothetical protein